MVNEGAALLDRPVTLVTPSHFSTGVYTLVQKHFSLEAEVGIELGKPAQLLPNPSPKPFGSRNFSSKLLYENPANNTLVNQANNANKSLTCANNTQHRWCPF